MSDIKYREEWLNTVAEELDKVAFKPNGYNLPPVQISCSWALGNRAKNKTTLGQCFPTSWSDGKINEIVIVPTVQDSYEIADTLAHELAHAVDDCVSGHGKGFKKICLAVGLNGTTKMRQAKAGEKLGELIKAIIKKVGEYPHDKVNISEKKKQTTRNLKVECSECGFSWRASNSMIMRMENHTCNGCGGDTLEVS
tara:strand:+ start:420 stop:1007 length:588 start_codon:yes stop_codon:yes gene_type:complete